MSRYRFVRFLVVAVCLAALDLSAAAKDWNDGSDNWSNPAAWTPAGVPGADDDAIISFNDDVARTVTYDYTGPDVTLNGLTVDLQGAVTNTITLAMPANSLAAKFEFVGSNGSGTFNQSGGTNTAGSLIMGGLTTASGTYNLSGPATLTVNMQEETIGSYGTGTFNQSGGLNSVSGVGHDLYLGGHPTGVGNYTLTGGTLSSGEHEFVGYMGTGHFDHAAGTNIVSGNLNLGAKMGSTGTYTLSATGQVSITGDLIVGDQGTGIFNQSGADSVVNARFVELGNQSGGVGSYTLSSGTLMTQSSGAGVSGTGTFTQSGGIHTTGSLWLGTASGSSGTYTLTAGTLDVSGTEVIGEFATGNGTQTGGTFTQSGSSSVHRVGTLIIGNQPGSTGSMSLASGTLISSIAEAIGDNGAATLTQTSGTHTSLGDITVAASGGSTGRYSLTGGTANAANISIGGQSGIAGGAGLLAVSGSSTTLTVPGTIKIYNTPGTSFALQSGTASVGAINVGGIPSRFSWTGGTLDITNDLALDSGVAADSTGAAFGSSLSLSSSKILKVTGNETIGGNGTFNLSLGGTNNGSVVHSVTGNITLKPGGTLSGNGGNVTYANLIQAGGTISGTSFRNFSNFNYQSGSFTATLINDGTVTFGPTFSLGGLQNESSFAVSDGQLLTTVSGPGITNSGTFTVNAGTLSTSSFTNTGTATFTAGGFTGFDTTITNSGNFVINAGTIPVSTVTNSGTFAFNGGTIQVNTFTNSASGSITGHGSFSGQLVNHGTLTVDGAFTFTNSFSLTQDGIVQGVGTISNANGGITMSNSAGGVINSTTTNGALAITNFLNNNTGAIINVGPTSTLSLSSSSGGSGSWTNSGTVNLQGPGARLSGGTINFQPNGLLQGAGLVTSPISTLNAGIIRASGGELDFSASQITTSTQSQIQVLAGSTVNFLQGLLTNSGTISLFGGAFENSGKGLTNSGTINGYGMLRTSGLTNNSGKLLSIGEGNMDILGTVTNNGVVSIQSGRTAYFFNNVSGSGSFTGTGTAVFLASLSPGNSPAQVNFAGSATLGGGTSLNMELGGNTVGTGYDKIDVEGQLAIGGALSVSLINGFNPAPWNTFDLMDWGTLAGTFSSINLPTLALGQWDTSKLYVDGTLSVTLGGDFNHDGMVDAADYVIWRKGLGTTYSQSGYGAWRAHFGDGTGGGGKGTSVGGASVPEPATYALLILAVFTILARRTDTRRR